MNEMRGWKAGETVEVLGEGRATVVGPDPDSNGILVKVKRDGETVSAAFEQLSRPEAEKVNDFKARISAMMRGRNPEKNGDYVAPNLDAVALVANAGEGRAHNVRGPRPEED